MMVVDAVGKRFGRLTVIERAGSNKKGEAMWLCLCECGKHIKARGNRLRAGKIQSCGCLIKETSRATHLIHGGRHDALYVIWKSMRQRCNDSNTPAYRNYGDRGISVCAEWNEYASFRDWAIKSGYTHGLDLDRINNNSGYNPENCRWVTRKENCNNQRRNIIIAYNGISRTATQWAEELGIKQATILWRYHHWQDVQKILFAPVRGA